MLIKSTVLQVFMMRVSAGHIMVKSPLHGELLSNKLSVEAGKHSSDVPQLV